MKQQKEEAKSNPDYDKSFKGQLSKEEKKSKRKQILSNIGALPLPHTSAPQPCHGFGSSADNLHATKPESCDGAALKPPDTEWANTLIYSLFHSAHRCLFWLHADWHVLLAGEDLLVASADKPFRFPATFTFVVRSFTVLDGIGKSLDPRFDISEIAAPYARDLILEAKPQFAKLQQEFNKRLDKQVSGACLPMLPYTMVTRLHDVESAAVLPCMAVPD